VFKYRARESSPEETIRCPVEFRELLLLVLATLLVSGCTTNANTHEEADSSNGISASSLNGSPTSISSANFGDNHTGCLGPGPLRTLWNQRKEGEEEYDFPVGVGDILHIQIAELPEYQDLTVRVGGDGAINLPLIGSMQVAGMNGDQLQNALSARISEYVTHPRVHVYVPQYHSRNVAVMGMVAKPGAYSLAGPSDSILDILGRAGGMTAGAAQKVVLFPVELNEDAAGAKTSTRLACADEPFNRPDSTQDVQDCRSALASSTTSTERDESSQGNSTLKGEPIVIDLTRPALAGCLDIPARPGDLVLVPASGQVGVYGWVQKPGTFDVSPGMTVLGAVTAAGGAMFSSNAEILRTASDGQRTVVPIDLSSVESGDKRDIPVEAGDLVLVRASALGLVPYTLSTIINKFGTGMFFPVP
jgi:polysaccharide export outer membrane protein